MGKTEVIVRRILGWKLNSWNTWYNPEKKTFVTDFKPEKSLVDAMLIVERLEKFGFIYKNQNEQEVCFNDICASGETLAEAITNAAYAVAEVQAIPDEWL